MTTSTTTPAIGGPPASGLRRRLAAGLLLACTACTAPITTGGCTRPDEGPVAADRFVAVELAGRTFRLEPAVDDAARAKGLMDRAEIPEGGGMIFIWRDAAMRRFWMKNCLVPIDLLFVDPRGFVTAVHAMPIEPPRGEDESEFEYEARLPGYSSRFPARYAIEVPAGTIEALGLRAGMRLDLDHEALAALVRE